LRLLTAKSQPEAIRWTDETIHSTPRKITDERSYTLLSLSQVALQNFKQFLGKI